MCRISIQFQAIICTTFSDSQLEIVEFVVSFPFDIEVNFISSVCGNCDILNLVISVFAHSCRVLLLFIYWFVQID